MLDPDGNERTIPVAANDDTIVWHSPEEYARLWGGVDLDACDVLKREREDTHAQRSRLA